MKKGSPVLCSKIARTLPHRKAKRLQIPKYISRIKCRRHTFKVTKTEKKVFSKIKHTFKNVKTPSLCNNCSISISDRISRKRPVDKNVGYLFRPSCIDDFLKNRTVKMVDSNLNPTDDHSLPLITITFDKILEIRKKRWSKKYNKKPLSSSLLRNSVIEVDDSDSNVNNVITVEENNLVGENTLSDLDLKEKNDVLEVEQNTSGTNINEQEEELQICNNSLYKSGNISSTEESSIIIIDDPTEQSIAVSEIDLTSDFTNSCVINKESTNSDNIYRDNLTESVSKEITFSTVLKENNKNNSNTNLVENKINNRITKNNSLQNDFEVIEIDDSNISMSASLGDVSCDQIPNTVSSSEIPICTDNFIPLTASTNRKRKRSSSNSVVALSDMSVHEEDLDNSDVIFVGECISNSSNRKRRKSKSRHTKNMNRRQKSISGEMHNQNVHPRVTRSSSRCQTINHQPFANNYNTLHSQDNRINHYGYSMHSDIPPPQYNNNNDNCFRPSLHGQVDTNICNIREVRRFGLREIIIDGSNVALGHSNHAVFSVKGLVIAINYFLNKGHKVTAFVPQYRTKSGQCTNPQQLVALNKRRLVVFTPSREVYGRRITPYDDRYIIQYANSCEGIVVSNDNFRDILKEKPQWKKTIEKRILMYTWVDDVLIFPEDPLGRNGPTLERFLRFP